MKKILLTVFIAFAMWQSYGVVRVTRLDPALGTVQIKNFVGFQYDYSQFQMSIETNYQTLMNKTHVGNLNMQPYAFVDFSNLNIPPSMQNGDRVMSGASIAIWYPNSLPGNATPANLVDFFQYGSAGHAYESVAVAAGKWTAGDYVSVAAPYQFNGGIADYGSSFFSTATSVPVVTAPDLNLQLMPNPATTSVKLIVPNYFNKTGQPVELIVFNIHGEAVLTTKKENTKEYFFNCDEFADGVYTVQLKDSEATILKTQFVKKNAN